MKKTWLIIGGILVALLLVLITLFISINNKTINLEEQINESKSAIEVKEKRRVDLILNLVDTVESYNKHEKETLVQLTEARSQAQKGNVEEAQLTIQAVSEAYPNLKSNENYKNLMTELSVTENMIAEQRDNFNRQLRSYNKFTRKFPSSIILSLSGYEKLDVDYLEYNAPEDAPKDLFKE